ncbi:MAG: sugar ABC transporter permease [Alphaproteobacteria bacterium]|nr:MAG: sugar ABC transporter permease [Alphaproteobacteria bacterium]
MSMAEGDLLHVVEAGEVPPGRRLAGRVLFWGASLLLIGIVIAQALDPQTETERWFANWRPTLYAYLFWAFALCLSQVLIRGEPAMKNLFVLPAALFTVSVVIFPLVFGVSIALSNWNLSSLNGRQFNGLDNFRQMLDDPFYWNAMKNMVWYTLAVVVEYAIAFGLALLLNAQIRGRRLFRVIFLMPLMLSPVAVSWMIGKSLMEYRFGPAARFARWLGWEKPAFFTDPEIARLSIMVLDAWTWIPLMMIILLAGLQALPKEVLEAAEVDGATGWQRFRRIVFPLMLPVSLTALLIRIIFKLKLADIIITVTSGGPGGATDSVTSFIYREYRDRSNVGYGTMLAFVYLIIIVVAVTLFINWTSRYMRRMT